MTDLAPFWKIYRIWFKPGHTPGHVPNPKGGPRLVEARTSYLKDCPWHARTWTHARTRARRSACPGGGPGGVPACRGPETNFALENRFPIFLNNIFTTLA